MSFSSFQPGHLLAILPEMALVVLAGLVMALDLALPDRGDRAGIKKPRPRLGHITAAGLFIVIVLGLLFSRPSAGSGELIFGGMLRDDLMAFVLRMMIIFAGGMTALLSLDVEDVGHRGDYYAILIASVIGMNFMVFSADLIMLYLAVETTGIAGYVLTGFVHRDDKSAEAGLKYFLFGATASHVMLFGFTLLYGFTGETNLYAIARVLASGQISTLAIAMISVLVVVGIGFKVAAVPFHFWTPDVYEGAPTPVTAFVSTASKAAGFGMLIRVFLASFSTSSDIWLPMLIAIAAVTMTLGNLVALAQRNIKRLLAYSSIAHAGYALVAFVALSELGIAATLFYLMTYVLTNLAAFAIVILFARAAGSDEIEDYAGLSRRSPYLALAMLVAFLSLAGMPPLAGFFGKVYVFAAAVKSGLIWLAFLGVLNAIVGLYYYLVVLKVVYIHPAPEGVGRIEVPVTYRFALAVLVVGILLLGTVSGPWFTLALRAAQAWL